jgi:hypothetical protein
LPCGRDPHLGDRHQLFADPDLFRLRVALFVSAFLVLDGRAEEITMIDPDIIVATVTPSSTFNRLPPDFGDPDSDDLDRLATSLHHLTLCCCEPTTDEASQHPAAEAVAMNKQLLVGVLPTAGEQL